MSRVTSTSNSATFKIERSVNQIERAEILLRQLPRKVYKEKKEFIDETTEELERIANKIKRELASFD